jgi:hypothetical protein
MIPLQPELSTELTNTPRYLGHDNDHNQIMALVNTVFHLSYQADVINYQVKRGLDISDN